MSTTAGVDWRIVGEEVGRCSCDWACPCQFEGDPTHGYCRVVVAMDITEGHFGDVDLTGVKFGLLVAFPGPLYEGNGSLQLFLDEAAGEEQRDAIRQLWTGEHGGALFEIFTSICPDKHETVVTSIDIDSDRERRVATVRIGEFGDTTIEPIKSPATGDEHRVRIDLPNGFEYKQAEVGNAVRWRTTAGEHLNLEHENTYAQIAHVKWSSDGTTG